MEILFGWKSLPNGCSHEFITWNFRLRMEFEHSPYLAATLTHWHYDVWEIQWDKKHAWFDFGTVRFNLDNNLEVTGMDFDVPNNDIFFEELKPYRVRVDTD
jgi:hypothetical protein